jgi:hypothetical protein
MDWFREYRRAHDGPVRIEDVVKMCLDEGHLDRNPKVDPQRWYTRIFKQAVRRRHFRDQQKRTVRELIAAKIQREGSRGQKYFDVVWDYLHEMSLDHALTAFSQRDDNFEEQRRAATRDLRSALDNNPNMAGHEEQFRFAFVLEEPSKIVTEAIEESPVQEPKESRDQEIGSKIAPKNPR